jgi:signal peptidase I
MSVIFGTKHKEGGLGEFIRLLVHAGIIALVIRTFFFQPFNIPSGSMKATLLVGDYLFVSKYSYGYSHYSLPLSPNLFSGRIGAFSKPSRGDVVVYINGQPVQRERIDDFIDEEEGRRPIRVRRWKETLPNGVSYTTLDLPYNLQSDNTEVYEVPPDNYFMMGDNRHNSTDSRFPQVGYVPFENIVGRAQLIFFSVYEGERAWEFWRWPFSVRWGRLFTIVR